MEKRKAKSRATGRENWQLLEIHPFAKRYRQMLPAEFLALKEDIRENGLQEPIILFDGKILDGRNRFLACLELHAGGLLKRGDPKFTEFYGAEVEAHQLVTSLN